MSHINKPYTDYSKLIGVSVVSVLMLVGCNKKEEAEETVEPEVTEQTTAPETSADLIACDDPVALVNLTQSIRSSVKQQVHSQMRNFSERSSTPVNMSEVDVVVNSILVDVATPQPLQEDNAGAMQTCQANLSVTMPSEDIYRASNIYAKLDGGTLQQRVQSQNLSLNNNMIVDKSFNYTVGVHGGQTVAKTIGQPEIVNVVGDLMAKSQLKVAVDEQRRVMRAAAEKRRQEQQRQAQQAAKQRAQRQQAARQTESQQRPSNTTNRATDETANQNPLTPSNSDNTDSQSNLDLPKLDGNGQLQGQSSVSSSREIVDPNAPTKKPNQPSLSESTISEPSPSQSPAASTNTNNSEFSVPKDDSIEMVITEEEGGY